MRINPFLLTDFYKIGHPFQYPRGTNLVYSNLTPRKTRLKNIDKMVFFGLQYFMKEYLVERFSQDFFYRPLSDVMHEYKRRVATSIGELPTYEHIEFIHNLGYLPIEIKALPEGSMVDMKIPVLTIVNTVPEAYWLTNFIESLMSAILWQPCTSATIAKQYRILLDRWAEKTGGDMSTIQWQGHDFSFRGMSSLESAITSAMGHLLSFSGTDTVPAIDAMEQYYNANADNELIGASVPATEHSVMCSGTKDDEIGTIKNLISNIYPNGIISIVSDTWDLWKVCTEYLQDLKENVLARDGKVVIRPDSGDPADIICGKEMVVAYQHKDGGGETYKVNPNENERKGVIELLWDVFGGTVNDAGYKVLDSHIGAIYGDSITLERANDICQRLEKKGFASTNIVFGIGSFTYQYNTRDTFGIAMKATYVEVNGEGREIFKDPITDDGTKKSATGLLNVSKEDGRFVLKDKVSWEEEKTGELKTVFLNGKIIKQQSFAEIKALLK